MLQIKRLENKDIKEHEKILKSYLKQLREPYIKTDILNEINRIYDNMCKFTYDGTAIILGALDDDKIVGFIWGYRMINNSNVIHINYFFVNENYRSNGIGSNLLEKFQNKINDYDKIELLVSKNNERALAFYKKYGFEIVETMSNDIKLYKLKK